MTEQPKRGNEDEDLMFTLDEQVKADKGSPKAFITPDGTSLHPVKPKDDGD